MRTLTAIAGVVALALTSCAARLPARRGVEVTARPAKTTIHVPRTTTLGRTASGWAMARATGSPDGRHKASRVVVLSKTPNVARPAPSPVPRPARRTARGRMVQTAVAVPNGELRETRRLFAPPARPAPQQAAAGCAGGT